MLGTLVNAIAIIFGSILGYFLKNGLPEKIKKITMQAIGLGVFLVGLQMAIITENLIVVILSLISGAIVGEWIDIEKYLEKVGNKLEQKIATRDNENSLAKGFVAATLLFCVGAMAITGAIQSGLTGDHSILFTKSVLDGITSIILTTTLGIGVIFSAISVLIYQGTITLLAGLVENLIPMSTINEITAIGGLLIIAISSNILEIKEIKVGNLLPALFFILVYIKLFSLFNL